MRNGETVVVPNAPGALIRPRARDDLDDVIDELLPDVDRGPGWFDAALVGGGLAAVGWEMAAAPPPVVTVVGVGALALGCVLPLRWAWRRVFGRWAPRERRGLPLLVADPETVRLVAAYDRVVGPSDAIAAAHGGVLEVATLLDGRGPRTERERDYVTRRAAAIEDLVDALESADAPSDALVEAREELEAIGDAGALGRLERLSWEARMRGGSGSANPVD